jgi:hypothetical protein
LVDFNGTDAADPNGSPVADANGDLLGTTFNGTGAASAGTPTTRVSFNGTDGKLPEAGLIIDSSGDRFGKGAATRPEGPTHG